nr:MAG TPA: hypothetical protein [Caudoviricetes sp.]
MIRIGISSTDSRREHFLWNKIVKSKWLLLIRS